MTNSVILEAQDGALTFMCPGCKRAHTVKHGAGPGPRWGWNGSLHSPTFTPSVLVSGWEPSDDPAEFEDGTKDKKVCCHSFVTEGEIIFLGDCTHALAGQTVALPVFPEGHQL